MSGMPPVPGFIRVLGQEFPVRVVGRDKAVSRDASHGTVGQTDLNLQTIAVRDLDELSPHQVVDTLLHEVLHAVVYLFNLRPYLEDGAEEDFVKAFAPALLHTLRDNEELVDAILAPDLRNRGHDAD